MSPLKKLYLAWWEGTSVVTNTNDTCEDPKVLYVHRAGTPSPLQRGLGKPSWNRFKWGSLLSLIWVGRKLQQRNRMGQRVEADDFVVCSRGRVELMFPQFGVGVGEVRMKQLAEAARVWPEGPWWSVRESVDFVLVSVGSCSRAAVRPRLWALCLPQSRKGLRSTVGEAGCDRKRTPWRLWEWGRVRGEAREGPPSWVELVRNNPWEPPELTSKGEGSQSTEAAALPVRRPKLLTRLFSGTLATESVGPGGAVHCCQRLKSRDYLPSENIQSVYDFKSSSPRKPVLGFQIKNPGPQNTIFPCC